MTDDYFQDDFLNLQKRINFVQLLSAASSVMFLLLWLSKTDSRRDDDHVDYVVRTMITGR